MSERQFGERVSWKDFPAVIRNSGENQLAKHMSYIAAKFGNDEAAINLVNETLKDDTTRAISYTIKDKNPCLLPVIATNDKGTDKVPLAIASVLADRLNLDVEVGIVQIDQLLPNDAKPELQLAYNPRFSGEVETGRNYLLLDDSLNMGGTIASLRGFIENRGGHVMSAMVMNADARSLELPISPKMELDLESKHSTKIHQFLKENFNYEIDKLTQREATFLYNAPSLDYVRDSITTKFNERVIKPDAEQTENYAPCAPSPM